MSTGVLDAPVRESLARDRVTWLTYCQLAVWGYFLYAFTPSVSLLGAEQGLSHAVAALHGTALALGGVVAGLVQERLTRRLGRPRVLWVGLAGIVVGALLFTSAGTLAVTLPGAMVAGLFGSLVVNTASTALTLHHRADGPAAVSEANAFAAGMGLLAPLVVGLSVAVGLGWRPGLLVVVVLAAGTAVVFRRRSGVPAPTIPAPRRGAHRLPRRYWAALGVLVLIVSTEFALTIWSSTLLRSQVGLSEGAATGCVTALIGGMALGRALGGRLARRHHPDLLLLGTFALSALGFAVLWTASLPAVAVAGLMLVGVGIALQFPLGIGRLIVAGGDRPDLAAGHASLGGGVAIAAAPFVLGALADAVGVHAAFLLVPVLLALAAVGVWLPRRLTTARG